MSFISLDFAVFLPIVFLFYWVFKSYRKFQNLIILAASYVFYGFWDYRFLSLIVFSTLVDFIIGKSIYRSKSKKKLLLSLSILVNIGLLLVFKYYNFFIDSLNSTFVLFGYPLNISAAEIVLPVGISFYTFQTLSYTIDIYRNRLEPTRSLIDFAAFVAFFPQLVAGPIERAKNLLPQFGIKRVFSYPMAIQGLRQLLWGLLKKMVIADNLANIVDQVYISSIDYNGSTYFLATLLFSIQIYADFSGYSDIAIGTAKLFGFKLMKNFNFPYFSRNIGEFWRRWHISLSTWFRDYVYIPMGGSHNGKSKTIRNLTIVFIISGLWHGANFTFITWGLYHVVLFIPLFLTSANRKYTSSISPRNDIPSLSVFLRILLTFTLVSLGWIFFRSENIAQSLSIFNEIFSTSLFNPIQINGLFAYTPIFCIIIIVFVFEWLSRDTEFALDSRFELLPKYARWITYMSIISFIGLFSSSSTEDFIYFQF